MIITITERGEYRRCKRRWHYGSKNRLGLEKIIPKPAFSLGDLIHKSLAEWLINPTADLQSLYMEESLAIIAKVSARYKEIVGVNPSDIELNELYETIGLGRDMMGNYQSFWKTPISDRFSIVETELKVIIPIIDTPHSVEAKFDGIIRNQHGDLFILEHKTYGARPRDEVLQSNDQFLGYLWALQQLNIGPVGGIAYDGMWKRATPPRGSTIEDLFTRMLLIRPQEEIDEFGKHLQWEVDSMYSDAMLADAEIDAGNYPANLYINRRWEGCFDCQFDPLCTAQSRGDDVDYIINTQYAKRELDEGELNE